MKFSSFSRFLLNRTNVKKLICSYIMNFRNVKKSDLTSIIFCAQNITYLEALSRGKISYNKRCLFKKYNFLVKYVHFFFGKNGIQIFGEDMAKFTDFPNLCTSLEFFRVFTDL